MSTLNITPVSPNDMRYYASQSFEDMRKEGVYSGKDVDHLKRSLYTSKYINVSSETTLRLQDLASDREFANLLNSNIEFSIPPFDNTIIAFTFSYASFFSNVSVDKLNALATIIFQAESTDDGYNIRSIISVEWNDDDSGMDFVAAHYSSVNVSFSKRAYFVNKILKDEKAEVSKGLDLLFAQMIAILFLLIHQRPEYIRDVPATHRMVGNKRVPYAAHKTIDLGLFEPKEIYTLLAPPKGSHASPRAHEVIGHWIHRGLGFRCEHSWVKLEPAEDDHRSWKRKDGTPYLRYVCEHCRGVRSFRNAHIRGDASKGFITHDYEA